MNVLWKLYRAKSLRALLLSAILAKQSMVLLNGCAFVIAAKQRRYWDITLKVTIHKVAAVYRKNGRLLLSLDMAHTEGTANRGRNIMFGGRWFNDVVIRMLNLMRLTALKVSLFASVGRSLKTSLAIWDEGVRGLPLNESITQKATSREIANGLRVSIRSKIAVTQYLWNIKAKGFFLQTWPVFSGFSTKLSMPATSAARNFSFLILFLAIPSSAEAVCHLYFVPAIGAGSDADPRTPKYATGSGFPWAAMDFGMQPIFLVAADVDAATDTTVSAQADVIRVPDNLDATLGGQLATVQTGLENRNIPAGWLTSGTTYRTALRTVTNMFRFLQRFPAVTQITAPLLDGSVNLDLQFNNLSATNQQRLIDTADSFGFDTSGLSGTTTLRTILKNVADQFVSVGFQLGCKFI